jgi:hypothetical protein
MSMLAVEPAHIEAVRDLFMIIVPEYTKLRSP